MTSAWRVFARRYGWRAYAVVVLTVVTVVVVLRGSPAGHAVRNGHLGAAGPAPTSVPLAHAAAGFDRPGTPQPVTVRITVESTGCDGNHYARLALVSLHLQRAWMCEGQRQVYSSPVTTGATVDGDQTPTGSWRVQARQRDRYLVGPGYKDYVHFWVPFNGDFGFHDATWQTMAFGSQGYRTQGSHGCVHLPMAAMQWFYRWVQVEQTVVTVVA